MYESKIHEPAYHWKENFMVYNSDVNSFCVVTNSKVIVL